MYAIVFLALFVLLAVVSLLGWTADSRDLRPHLPLQARGDQRELPMLEPIAHAALPPHPRPHAH